MIHLLLAVLLSGPLAHAQSITSANALPSSWINTPEEVQGPSPSHRMNLLMSAAEPSDGFSKQVERLFSTTSSALDTLPPDAYGSSLMSARESRPKDWVPWHLDAVAMDLSVTAQGLVGLLTLRGTSAVSVFWRKKTNMLTTSTYDTPESSNEVSGASSNVPSIHSAAEIEPVVRALMKTGRVRNEQKLRAGLTSWQSRFQTMFESMEGSEFRKWWVSGLRLDLLVDASGMVFPGITVGNELRVRMEWKRYMKSTGTSTASVRPARDSSSGATDETQKSMKELVTSLERVVSGLSLASLENEGFNLYSMRFGIGVSGAGSIGLAKGSIAAIGSINLNRNDKPRPRLEANSAATGRILMVERNPSANHVAYAKNRGIEMKELEASNERDQPQAIYSVPEEAFQKGLNKAISIAAFFAARKGDPNSSQWRLFELRPNFDLSMTGDVVLAKVGGNATAMLYLRNREFK